MELPTIDGLIKDTADQKVLPFVARKVIGMVADDNTSIQELSNTIEKDQSIATKILKIANSPFYGLAHEVTSLRQAILVLGFNSIKDLVITISTRSQYKRFGITEQMMWDHSIGTAIASKMVSDMCCTELKDLAFLGGLMHDLGKVIINNEAPEAYVDVMKLTYNEDVESICAEHEVFGYDHTEVGSRVAAKWGFPRVFSEIMARHHLRNSTLEDIEDMFTARSVACVNLADNICKTLGIGYRIPNESVVIEELASTSFLGLKPDRIEGLVSEIGEVYEKESSAFY